MLFSTKHPWRRTLLQAGVLYFICVAALLWLLSPPVHIQFTTDRNSRLFSPSSEPALIRLISSTVKPHSLADYCIEHVNLQNGQMTRIPLVTNNHIQVSIHSRDGSVFLTMNDDKIMTVFLWDGKTGKLRHEKPSVAQFWNQLACSPDGSRFAARSNETSGDIVVIDAHTGIPSTYLTGLSSARYNHVCNLQFSLDAKWLFCSYQFDDTLERTRVSYLFDLESHTGQMVSHESVTNSHEIIPAMNGFWISQWDRSDKTFALAFLDARTRKCHQLDSTVSSRLGGFPHIFSDNAGHLYLLQNRKSPPDNWQKRTRQTIIDWLKKLGFEQDTTDEIVLRHISPDGKRLISEQTFSANYAEISPDGQYLILMSQMKDDTRYVVYHYPTRLNWKHSLLWSLIPAMLLLLLQRWRRHGQNRVD